MADFVPVLKKLLRRYVSLFGNVADTCKEYSIAGFRLTRVVRNLTPYLIAAAAPKSTSVMFEDEQKQVRFLVTSDDKTRAQYWRMVFDVAEDDMADVEANKAIDFAKMMGLASGLYNEGSMSEAMRLLRVHNEHLDDLSLVFDGRRCYLKNDILNLKTKFFITFRFEPDVE